MLYKVFIDESGKKEYITPYSRDFINNPPLFDKYEQFWWDNYFSLCGVRVKQKDLGKINSKINDLKQAYFKTHKVEVKSDWLRNPHQRKKHYFKPFSIKPEKLNDFGEKFVNLIAGYHRELKLFAVVFDKRYYGDSKRNTSEGTPLLKTTQVLFERLEFAGKSRMTPYPYFDRIRCNFFYNPLTTQVRGYGLVCVPDIKKINWNLLKGCFNHKKSPHK